MHFPALALTLTLTQTISLNHLANKQLTLQPNQLETLT